MVRLTVAVFEVEPEVPVTVTVYVPEAPEVLVIVIVDVVLPFDGGVTELGEKEAETPAGRPEAVRATAELKPFVLVTVTVLLPAWPGFSVSEAGEADTEKSGVATPPQPGNLKEATRLLQLNVPVVFRYSVVNQNVQSSTGSTVSDRPHAPGTRTCDRCPAPAPLA